jgi:OmpA-OmpF porin, OOP family
MANHIAIPLIAGITLLTAACTNDVAQLELATPAGDAFTENLTDEYRQIARFEAHQMVDWKDAQFFAAKGLKTAKGEIVKPESPDQWRTPSSVLDEMKFAHRRLVAILETGVRNGDPQTSARAQGRFDCWVEQQEENWQKDHIAACKSAFERALEKLETSPEVQAARFTMVLFPFDSARIIEGEMEMLAALIKRAGELGFSAIEVAGHTDRQGTVSYNNNLSRSRADAVSLALFMEGIPPEKVKVSAYGESQPRVATADGVRESINRRVEIWLRKPQSSKDQIDPERIVAALE